MNRLAACAVISVLAHFGFARALELLPPEVAVSAPRVIEIQVVSLPPPPPPPVDPVPVVPPPVSPPPTPTPPLATTPPPAAIPSAHPHEAAPAPPQGHVAHVAAVASDTPVPEQPAVVTDTGPEQVFQGGDMSSSSTGGTGPPGSTGTGTGAGAGPATGPVTPGHGGGGHGDGPIAEYEATRMPLPQGRCFGKYTPEATAAGTEGTVVLDLVVGEDGHTKEIVATSKLPNGLTQSAIAALRECQFSPGEKDGKPVAVKIHGFKIRFVLQEAQQ